MEPLAERRLDVAGHRTRVLEAGPADAEGPTLLLLHGFADSADTWRGVLAGLAARGRRAVAADLPGFGAATALRHGPVLPQLDAFARGLLERYAGDGGPEVVVVGNSLGGAVALRLAERADELPLAGVVPVAPAGLDMPAWFGIIERDPILRPLLALPVPIPPLVLRAAVAQAYRTLAFARPRDVAREVVDTFASHHRDRATVGRILDAGRRMLPELTEPFLLRDIGCPVLLVWGDRDRMVHHRGAERVLAALPETRVEILPGCGHCPQIEETERLVELLIGFA